MTKTELLNMLIRDAKEFRQDRGHYERNTHMHAISVAPEQEAVDAVLVGFLNYVARKQCIDLALYAKDFSGHPNLNEDSGPLERKG